MRTKNELYQEALRTVALRRQTARALAQDAQAQAEAAIPALRHAEEEVRVRGIRCALAGAAGKDRTEAAAALADARQKLTALLAESGRPANALEPHFTCPKCQDTGSVNGRTCVCVHKVMQQLRRQEIEALSSLSISSFDTMKLEYYPSVADPEVGETIRTYMAEVLADLRDYAADFSPATRESLLLLGNAGLGKTHAALAIAGEVLRQNYDVIYVSCPDFFGKLEALHFGSDPNGEEEALFQTASNADLLILDDLGTEFNSSFFLTNLYSLLNNRLGAKLPTIVTTNVTDGTLLEKLYTEKISSRLAGFVQIKFFGNDIRVQKANEEKKKQRQKRCFFFYSKFQCRADFAAALCLHDAVPVRHNARRTQRIEYGLQRKGGCIVLLREMAQCKLFASLLNELQQLCSALIVGKMAPGALDPGP